MQLVVLGSGTSVPHPQRTAAAFWLETDHGSILLDCSPDAPHRMAAENLDWPNLAAIWISHLHLDHCGGLAPLLFGWKWARQTQSREKTLKIFGCTGVERLLKAIDEVREYKLFTQPFAIDLREINEETREFSMLRDLQAQTFSTPHTDESLALRVSDGRQTIVYSSDTGFSEGLAQFAYGADLLILECSFRRNKPSPKHLELSEAMRIAELAAPRKLLLTHLYPEWDGIDIAAEARQIWPGEIIAARDGLRVEIQD